VVISLIIDLDTPGFIECMHLLLQLHQSELIPFLLSSQLVQQIEVVARCDDGVSG